MVVRFCRSVSEARLDDPFDFDILLDDHLHLLHHLDLFHNLQREGHVAKRATVHADRRHSYAPILCGIRSFMRVSFAICTSTRFSTMISLGTSTSLTTSTTSPFRRATPAHVRQHAYSGRLWREATDARQPANKTVSCERQASQSQKTDALITFVEITLPESKLPDPVFTLTSRSKEMHLETWSRCPPLSEHLLSMPTATPCLQRARERLPNNP
eukprot:5336524-Pleurochrysis_carterae.AAC.1